MISLTRKATYPKDTNAFQLIYRSNIIAMPNIP